MTNTIYHNIVRDDDSDSVSSSRLDEFSVASQDEAAIRSSILSSVMAMVRRRLPKKHSSNLKHSENLKCFSFEELRAVNLKCFSFEELRVATGNFQSSNSLGKGGYVPVYKGWIETQTLTASESGTNIAVALKRLPLVQGCAPSLEVEAVNRFGQLCHPNLVRIFGYCSEAKHSTLVYEFMPQGSLEDHLFGGTSPQHLLGDRIKVALGVAKGLAFLHNNGSMHALLKPSNILLDSNYSAKLSEFGFAQISPDIFSGAGIETPNGEFEIGLQFINGYTDPICINSGFTAKSDVYSFGVVLLEMLWNRRIETKLLRNAYGTSYDWLKDHDGLINGKDTSILCNGNSQYTAGDIRKALDLASSCISWDVYSRPTMDEVVIILESICPITINSIASDVQEQHYCRE